MDCSSSTNQDMELCDIPPAEIVDSERNPTEERQTQVLILLSKIERLQKKCKEYEEVIKTQEKNIVNLEKCNNNMKNCFSKFLNDDQILFLEKGSLRGYKWENTTITKALKIRLACGTSGYNLLREIGQPLPSERTLYRRIQHLKFAPGILYEILSAFQNKSENMREEEKYASLILDEMKIESKYDYDSGTGSILGKPTLPSSNGQFEDVASHGLVYMLAGTTSRWKQVIGYQFTGNSFCAQSVLNDIYCIIREAEKIGLHVDVVISDMASTNRAIWRIVGIQSGRYSKTIGYCKHPCNSERRLYFSPDTPHVFKHIRDHLTNGQCIIIPDEFVERYYLPSNIVNLEHIKFLINMDEEHDLKLAPNLNKSCIELSHFEKMKVGPALRLIHNDTAGALKYCVERGLLPKEALTTAWFMEIMYKWFKFVTSRHSSLAIHSSGLKKEEIISFFKEIIRLFEGIQIGIRKTWKPVQTGVILATSNAIDLADYYLTEKNFRYLCLGRFTQDALENLFSTLRMINPVPSPKHFKMGIRIITVSQFFKPNRRGSYEVDDVLYLEDFLQQNAFEDSEEDTELFLDVEHLNLDVDELNSLYYLAGYTVRNFFNMHKKFECKTCKDAITTTADDPDILEFANLIKLKALSDKIIFVTRNVFELLRQAEIFLRNFKNQLLKNQTKISTITQNFFHHFISPLPLCHGISEKLVGIFYRIRIHLILRKHNDSLSVEENVRCDSRSIAMRRAIKRIS